MTSTISSSDLDISKNKRILTAEAKYQEYKQQWYFHQSSWYRRNNGEGGYDSKGCNQFTGCISECKFYRENGRLGKNEGFD